MYTFSNYTRNIHFRTSKKERGRGGNKKGKGRQKKQNEY
jgi:hypothetical protein